MSFEKAYLAVHNSPSFGGLSPAFSTGSSALPCAMTPPMMPLVGYAGHPMLMATLSPHGPLPMASFIDKSNPPPRRTGFCKFFNVGKGFGFIKDSRPEELPTLKGDPGTDIFVHYSCIVSCDAPYKSLLDGEPVEYYLGRSNKGLAALEITGPGGANVKGSTNSRSPTVLHPMPTFTDPLGQTGAPVQSETVTSPAASPKTSPTSEPHLSQTSPGWSLPMSGSQTHTFTHHSNSPTFPLAVGMPLTMNQHLRRETTECLGIPNYGSATKMYRMSSTPISAPGFGSSHLKEFRDSATLTSLGVGIGIGVHWEPQTRGHAPQWSPPGGRRSVIKDHSSHYPSSNLARRAGDTSVDRTKSNWRDDDIKIRGCSPSLTPQSFSPTIST